MMKAISSLRRLVVASLLASIASTAVAGNYVKVAEKRRTCEKSGNYAISVYQRYQKQPNMFLVEKSEIDKKLLNEHPGSPITKIANGIWLEIFISETIGNEKDAYEYGWAYCMDQKF